MPALPNGAENNASISRGNVKNSPSYLSGYLLPNLYKPLKNNKPITQEE